MFDINKFAKYQHGSDIPGTLTLLYPFGFTVLSKPVDIKLFLVFGLSVTSKEQQEIKLW